jgi:hypothetical protein
MQNKDKAYIYIKHNNIINIPMNVKDYYNKYIYNDREVTLYEYYINNYAIK